MAEALKDQFFQKEFFVRLGKHLKEQDSSFDESSFLKNIFNDEWKDLSLTQRMSFATRVIQKMLPADYTKALEILKKVCVHFNGFEGMIFSDFVQQFGLDHEKESLDALELFTQYGSAEFAIRPFIKKNESEVMDRMRRWSKHKNYHVRRLSTEGCRPRLPWSMALPAFKKDPSVILPILENLKEDPELYVRKSVANNLNDLTKDNPDLVLNLVEKWVKSGNDHTQWIIKQGLRSLIKDGNQRALKMLGFDGDAVVLSDFKGVPKKLKFGEAIEFSFQLLNKSKSTINLMVDYLVYFQKSNGSLAPKVFKLKAVPLEPKEKIELSKKHRFEEISTRKYYPGQHKIAVQVNGKILEEKSFQLVF